MDSQFKTIALVGKQNTTDVAETLCAIIKHLKKKRVNVVLEKDTAAILPNCKLPAISNSKLKLHCELVIVVGGDGSLLRSARFASIQNLPVLGVNRGHLGFLTDILPSHLEKIDAILAGNYQEEERFLLQSEIIYKTKLIAKKLALNDLVFLSAVTGNMVHFGVYINSHFVCDYRADGLIIATPTGSTAHALSGGGPILHPIVEAMVLVPMFSHNLSSRPLVIDNESSINIKFYANNINKLHINADGQSNVLLAPGGEIKISKAPVTLRLLHPTDYNYFETLRSKLHWELQ